MLKNYAYLFDSKDLQALKKILEADPYAEDSIARLGFVLKESASVGLAAGKYVVFIKAEEDMAKKVAERLKPIPSFAEAKPEETAKVAEAIEKEESSATEGFGSIFG